MPYVGILQAAGLAKEDSVGTLKTTPTEFLPLIAPDSFSETISLLESKGIRAQPDAVVKVVQGPADLKSGKVKVELEPENCGNLLMAAFGTDGLIETAEFVVTLNTNDFIDFKESGGSQIHAQIAAGTYIAGITSATASTLCKAIKTAMDAASGAIHTYAVTYSDATRKFTITPSAGTLQILWNTGTNTAKAAKTLLGFTNADTNDAAAQTSDGTTENPAFTHIFTRASVAQLPTYTWWFQKGAKYFQFAGCMLNKMDIDIKSKEMVVLDTDWTALTYDDSGGSQSPSYSTLKPFKFNQAVVKIDSSQVNNYEEVKISVDNMVEADHVLAGTIYPAKIYSKGMRVTLSMVLFLEDTTQWAKFLAGTSAAVEVILTSGELITGTAVPYKLDIVIPVVNYSAAPLHIESGILKVNFSAVAVYDASSSKTISVSLTNSRVTTY